jgi:hypothetical protein
MLFEQNVPPATANVLSGKGLTFTVPVSVKLTRTQPAMLARTLRVLRPVAKTETGSDKITVPLVLVTAGPMGFPA